MKIIAHVYNDFPGKFGLPRQSGMAGALISRVVFTKEYRVREALRGLSDFSHIWLLWEFDTAGNGWSPTVRPPRLGGNKRVGVFATRSPFRPNPIGLSCVRLEKTVREEGFGDVLYVSGADMKNGTPVYDIKPYIPLSDCRPDARGSFSDEHREEKKELVFPGELLSLIPEEKRAALSEALSLDPRPAYHDDPERIYFFEYAGYRIGFSVNGEALSVRAVEKL